MERRSASVLEELFDAAQTVASALAQRGIARGDAVALMLPTSLDFFVTFAGVLLAGGVPVPIYPPVRADRIAEYAERQSAILRNAEARLLVTFHEAATAAKLLRPRVPSLGGIVTAADLRVQRSAGARDLDDAATRTDGSDLTLLQYTSGSTGDPKGVTLTNGNLLANVRAIGEALSVRPDDVGVSWLPLYHDIRTDWRLADAALFWPADRELLSPLAFLTRPERWLQALSKHRGTLTAAPNFAYELAIRKVAEKDLAGLDLTSVRAMLNGAEPVNAGTLERFAERFAPMRTSPGSADAGVRPGRIVARGHHAAAGPRPARGGPRGAGEDFRERGARHGPCASDSDVNDPERALSFVSVGKPVPGHEVRIVAGSGGGAGREVSEREEGLLWFRGPSATGRYF